MRATREIRPETYLAQGWHVNLAEAVHIKKLQACCGQAWTVSGMWTV
jgi:hypothetical protein